MDFNWMPLKWTLADAPHPSQHYTVLHFKLTAGLVRHCSAPPKCQTCSSKQAGWQSECASEEYKLKSCRLNGNTRPVCTLKLKQYRAAARLTSLFPPLLSQIQYLTPALCLTVSSIAGRKARALYACKAEHDSELSFIAGTIFENGESDSAGSGKERMWVGV